MAILPVHLFPEPILRQKSKRVRTIDKSIQRLIGNMLETMHSTGGVGLAAPQVGTLLRVIVIGIPGEEDIALINPEIVRRTGERLVDEGCLSIPGMLGRLSALSQLLLRGVTKTVRKFELRQMNF